MSPKGARGLGQLMPETAALLGVEAGEPIATGRRPRVRCTFAPRARDDVVEPVSLAAPAQGTVLEWKRWSRPRAG
ncbi:hypothetical protein [Amaricoccus sp. W119]|uniref:hypothetical protein n=1 Tax=Amaricoccus sp. W119 TaxID=3391833 RepID=UPI0039A430AA